MHAGIGRRSHGHGSDGHQASRRAGRKPKPTIPYVEAGAITATSDEDEAELFLHTLKFALSEDFVPTAQHIQILLYLVCYGPPPPQASGHPSDKDKSLDDGYGQGKEADAKRHPAGSQPSAHSPEYIDRIASLALDVLDNVLTLHTARDVGRMIPHITHGSSEPAGPSAASKGNRGVAAMRGDQRGRYSSSLSASPEKEVYASELIGRDDDYDDSDYTSKPNGRVGIFAKAASRSGSGAPQNRVFNAQPPPAASKKRKRKTGILYAADFGQDSDEDLSGYGTGRRGDAINDTRDGGNNDHPAWLQWRASGGSRLQRETYRAMRALEGTGQGGKGGTGVWPLLWADAPDKGGPRGTDRRDAGVREASESDDQAKEDREDGQNEEKGKGGISTGGWKLLGWLVRLWEQDARETKADSPSATDTAVPAPGSTATYGRPSPLFLQQLPKYSAPQISDASNVKRVIESAFGERFSTGVQAPRLGRSRLAMPEVQARRACAGQVLQLLAQSALPTHSSPAAFHPQIFTFEFLSLLRPLSSLSSTDLLNHLDTVPWTMRSHLMCLAIEELARVRSDRDKDRTIGKRDDFAPLLRDTVRGKVVMAAGGGAKGRKGGMVFAPPRVTYLRDILQLSVEQTSGSKGDSAAATIKNVNDKMANFKLALVSLLLAKKDAYLKDYRHGLAVTATTLDSSTAQDPAFPPLSLLDLDQSWADSVEEAFTSPCDKGDMKATLTARGLAGVVVQLLRQLAEPISRVDV